MAKFEETLALSVGMDGVDCFKHSSYSVIPVGVKLWNLHESTRTNWEFLLLSVLIPGGKKPKRYDGYLQPLIQEIKSVPKGGNFGLELITTEQDHVMLCDTTEHMGVMTTCNCTRCQIRAVPNPATNAGKYIVGYADGSAFNAPKKDNEFTRTVSKQVEKKVIEAKAFGIREPSLFATNFPDFDVCYGEFIEFFHKLKHVTPSTFWKKHVFIDYKGEPPVWVMNKRNREIFRKRVDAIVPTHDIGRKPLDPNTEKMKAEDWDVFVVTTSPLAQGLIAPEIYEIWDHFRQGYLIHLSNVPLTLERREQAKKHWAQFAVKSEKLMPITMMTVATHLVAVEADHQIEYSGKIQESMSSWIERLCGNLVEDTRRRRICYSPETTMIRSFLLKHYLKCHEHLLPKLLEEEERSRSALYDEGSDGIRLLGKGRNYQPSKDEEAWIWDHLCALQQAKKEDRGGIFGCTIFQRAEWKKSEFHSKEYQGVRSSRSYNAVVLYLDNRNNSREYFGQIEKFFKVNWEDATYRLALVSCFKPITGHLHRVSEKTYSTGRIVSVASLDRKVIFHRIEGATWVLEASKGSL